MHDRNAWLRAQADEVLLCANRAAEHWKTANASVRERATAIRLLGIGHQLKGHNADALMAFNESLDLRRSESAESEEVAICLSDLADFNLASGNLEQADHYYRESMRISNAVGNHEGVIVCTGNLASIKLKRGNWPEAETLARKALLLSEGIGRQESIANNNRRLADALNGQGLKPNALPYAKSAVDIYKKLNSPVLVMAQATLRNCES